MKNTYYFIFACFIFLGCSNDENPGDDKIALSDYEISMDFNQTYTIEATFDRDGYPQGSLVWQSADEEVAIVDNTGKVTARLIGETQLTVKTSDGKYSETVKVEVLPTVTLYKEPILQFGESASYIKSNESRTLISETSEALIFEGENSDVRGAMYLIENSKFTTVAILLKTDEATAEKAANHLVQRYTLEGREDDIFIFSRGEVSLGITADATIGLLVVYTKAETSFGGRMKNFKDQLETLRSLDRILEEK
jgi:hypothetical protein